MRRHVERRYHDYDIDDPPIPLGTRLARFVGLLGALFAVSAAVIVTQRLSHDALALLLGLSCGVMVMLPTLALGLFIWRREDARRQARQQQSMSGPAATPPVIVVTPQALPGYGQTPAFPSAQAANPWTPAHGERVFKIVGGEE